MFLSLPPSPHPPFCACKLLLKGKDLLKGSAGWELENFKCVQVSSKGKTSLVNEVSVWISGGLVLPHCLFSSACEAAS